MISFLREKKICEKEEEEKYIVKVNLSVKRRIQRNFLPQS